MISGYLRLREQFLQGLELISRKNKTQLITESRARVTEILVVPAGKPAPQPLLGFHFHLSNAFSGQSETGSQVLQSGLFTHRQDARGKHCQVSFVELCDESIASRDKRFESGERL